MWVNKHFIFHSECSVMKVFYIMWTTTRLLTIPFFRIVSFYWLDFHIKRKHKQLYLCFIYFYKFFCSILLHNTPINLLEKVCFPSSFSCYHLYFILFLFYVLWNNVETNFPFICKYILDILYTQCINIQKRYK